MKKAFKVTVITLLCLAVLAATVLFVCTNNIPVLMPQGMIGDKERSILVTCTLLMLIVVIPVFILTLVFAWRYRETNEKAKYDADWEHNSIAECCWWGVPFVIIIIISVITWRSSHELNPFRPLETGKKPLTVQVVALNWKWLFIYPEQGIATVNYVQFPENTPVNFEITADAPMNSFWIPQLGGMIMAMPGMRAKLYLIADEEGTYNGRSSQISGTGFAGMQFTAKSSTEADFNRWVQGVRQSPKRLTMQEYHVLAEPSEYNPIASYVLIQEDLFDRILMKYLVPAK